MRIAVIQHQLRPTPAQDLEALLAAIGHAVERGAEVIVVPEVPPLDDGPLGEDLWKRLEDVAPGVVVIASRAGADSPPTAAVTTIGPLGPTALLSGDACMDGEALAAVKEAAPEVAVLAPRAESELQAQAVLELAIGLSTSLASLVMVAEADGADLGDPGHGGSAIVHLGEVLAEALAGDELLFADLELPVGTPEPAGPLPGVPPVLLQRLGAHRGHRLPVEYPADPD